MPATRGKLSVIFLTVLIDLIGFGIILPILPYVAQRFGAGGLGLGVLMGSYSGMQFVATLALGRLSDRVGRRPILLATIVFNVAGYLLFGLAGSYAALLVARLVSGFAAGNIAVAQAYIADVTPASERAKSMGIIGAAFGIGAVIGPALGGFAAHLGGPAAPGLLAAAISAVNLVLAWRILPESLQEAHRTSGPLIDRAHAREAFGHHALRPLLFMWPFAALAWSGYITVLPLYTDAAFGWQERELGWFFAVVGTVSIVMQGWAYGKLARLVGDKAMLLSGAVVMSGAIAVIPLLDHVPWFWVWTVILVIGNGVFTPAATGLVSVLAAPEEQGSILGLAQALGALGRLLGPEAFGLTFDLGGDAVTFVSAGAVMAVAALAAAKVGGRRESGVSPR